MKILFTPQIPLDGDNISYMFNADSINIRVVYQGVIYTDILDFKGLPNGKLDIYDENGNERIETDLPINVLLSAEKVNGELRVELLNWISSDASEEERFPDWVDSSELNPYKPKDETEGWDDF